MNEAPFSYSHALAKASEYDKSNTLTIRDDTFQGLQEKIEEAFGSDGLERFLLGIRGAPAAVQAVQQHLGGTVMPPPVPAPGVATDTVTSGVAAGPMVAAVQPPPVAQPAPHPVDLTQIRGFNQPCPKCGQTMTKLVPAGISTKSGAPKPYPAFFVCQTNHG